FRGVAQGPRVHPAEEENFRNLPEFPVQGQFRDERDVPARKWSDQPRSPQHSRADEAVVDMDQTKPLTDLDESMARPSRVQVATVFVLPDDRAPRIDQSSLRVGEHHGRLAVEDLGAARKRFGGEQIVTVGPPKILSRRGLEYLPVVGSNPAIR